MKNKLFDIIDDEPIINALIINLGPFKKLYLLDKSEDKAMYKRQLLFCYYESDYHSPYFDLDEKREKICTELYGKPNAKISKILNDASIVYYGFQSTPERRALEAAISSCDTLSKNLSNLEDGNRLLAGLLKDIDKAISQCDTLDMKIELFEKRQEIEGKMLTNSKTNGDLLLRISKFVEAIASLRKQANKSVDDLIDKSSIEGHLVDELIDSRELGD